MAGGGVQVLESGKAVEAAQRALGQAADELSSVVQLVTTLMAMRFDMDADSAQVRLTLRNTTAIITHNNRSQAREAGMARLDGWLAV